MIVSNKDMMVSRVDIVKAQYPLITNPIVKNTIGFLLTIIDHKGGIWA